MPLWPAYKIQCTRSVLQPSLMRIRQHMLHPVRSEALHCSSSPGPGRPDHHWLNQIATSWVLRQSGLTLCQAVGEICPITLVVACPGAFGLFRTVFHEAADNLRLVMDNTLPPSLAPVTGRQQPFDSERPFAAPLLYALCHRACRELQPLLQQA